MYLLWEKIQELARREKSRGPEFCRWTIDNKSETSSVAAQSTDFRFAFRPSIARKPYSFHDEVFRACAQLDQARKNKSIALCYSGGIDSELIALALAKMGLPFELYFLDIWGKNRVQFNQWSPALEKVTGKKVRIIEVNRAHFYDEHSLKIFQEFGCELPTYLAMTYLFNQIPRDEFIVVGDGDLDRTGKIFARIAENAPRPTVAGTYLPFSYSSVFYHLWAKKFRREGEFYFFSSTPELIAAALTDSHFQLSYPNSDTREIIYAAFPEIKRRGKTTNWDGENFRENTWIRTWLQNHAKTNAKLKYWKSGIGAVVRMDDLFLSH